MDYREFIEDIRALHFIKDDATAEAAIKAVLGMLSSSLQVENARKMAGALPESFDILKLRGEQAEAASITFEQGIAEIAKQFHLDEEHARVLANTVLRSTRAALGGEKLGLMEDILPESWSAAIEDA